MHHHSSGLLILAKKGFPGVCSSSCPQAGSPTSNIILSQRVITLCSALAPVWAGSSNQEEYCFSNSLWQIGPWGVLWKPVWWPLRAVLVPAQCSGKHQVQRDDTVGRVTVSAQPLWKLLPGRSGCRQAFPHTPKPQREGRQAAVPLLHCSFQRLTAEVRATQSSPHPASLPPHAAYTRAQNLFNSQSQALPTLNSLTSVQTVRSILTPPCHSPPSKLTLYVGRRHRQTLLLSWLTLNSCAHIIPVFWVDGSTQDTIWLKLIVFKQFYWDTADVPASMHVIHIHTGKHT